MSRLLIGIVCLMLIAHITLSDTNHNKPPLTDMELLRLLYISSSDILYPFFGDSITDIKLSNRGLITIVNADEHIGTKTVKIRSLNIVIDLSRILSGCGEALRRTGTLSSRRTMKSGY